MEKAVLKSIIRKEDGGVDWVDLALYRNGWWAIVNTVMNPLVPLKAGRISRLAEQLSASQEASMFRAANYPDLT